ncbi:hypothetical protein IHE44_0011366 [Lamprotornis superbus]|uniref:Uncharacterized protein n=1 Tax=Lamprotornis superbus TaxID=245042 RepID=A0A835NJI9_9PASS|nr:hypothetical protein IHE44_0011366 [Lamprotornis superbus]
MAKHKKLEMKPLQTSIDLERLHENTQIWTSRHLQSRFTGQSADDITKKLPKMDETHDIGLKFMILFHQTCAEQYKNNWLMQVIQQLIPTEVVVWITLCLPDVFHGKD